MKINIFGLMFLKLLKAKSEDAWGCRKFPLRRVESWKKQCPAGWEAFQFPFCHSPGVRLQSSCLSFLSSPLFQILFLAGYFDHHSKSSMLELQSRASGSEVPLVFYFPDTSLCLECSSTCVYVSLAAAVTNCWLAQQ